MKTIPTIIALLTCSFIYSQEYIPLLDVTKKWSTVDEYFHLTGGDANRSHHIYLYGDTLIGDSAYLKVYRIDDYYSTEDHIGYIREDTSKKIYYRNLVQEEGMIYNFAANVADTIEFCYYQFPSNPIYAVVADIQSFNSTIPARRMLVLKDLEIPSYTEEWIEGIGSNRGLLESGFTFSELLGAQYNLLCYAENDSLIYLNPRFTSCSNPMNVGFKEEQTNIGLAIIYPNPVSGLSSIKINHPANSYTFEFFNIMGQSVLNKTTRNNTIIINSNDFSDGVVFYRIHARDKTITGTFQVIK